MLALSWIHIGFLCFKEMEIKWRCLLWQILAKFSNFGSFAKISKSSDDLQIWCRDGVGHPNQESVNIFLKFQLEEFWKYWPLCTKAYCLIRVLSGWSGVSPLTLGQADHSDWAPHLTDIISNGLLTHSCYALKHLVDLRENINALF